MSTAECQWRLLMEQLTQENERLQLQLDKAAELLYQARESILALHEESEKRKTYDED